MNLLAIETSTKEASVALQFNGQQWQQALGVQHKQIEQILPVIETLLTQAGARLIDLNGLVLSAGPGSFTGLRLGLGILQGISLATELPIAAISSLQILAQTMYRLHDCASVVCATNAFMGEIYFGVYQSQAGIMQAVQPDTLVTPQSLFVPPGAWFAAGDAWEVYHAELPLQEQLFLQPKTTFPEARDMLTLAESLNDWQSIDSVNIQYLRKKEAWQRKG